MTKWCWRKIIRKVGLGPVLIGHCFWKRLNFPEISSDCGFSGNDNRKLTTCANPKLTTLSNGYNYE